MTAKETEFITQAYPGDVRIVLSFKFQYAKCKIIMIIGKVPPSFEEYVKGRDSQFPKVNIITLIMIM